MTPAFIAHLANFGDATALRDDAGVQLSYRALAAAVADFAERLAGPPGFVLIETRNTIDTVVAIYGAMAAGRATLLTKAADDTGFARLADIYRPASIVRQGAKALRVEAGSDDPAAVHHELALLLSTSGTTGATKLVRLSGDNVDANARSIADYLGITPSDCALANLPLHYSYGLSVLNSHLLAGASVMLTEQAISGPGFRALCERAPITSMAGVPYSYELLEAARFCDWAPPTLRTMSQAGGRMPPEQVLAWHDWLADRGGRLFIMYGQTEATARMAYVDPAVLSQKPDAIGRAIPGGTLSLIDEAGEPVTAAGAEGELIYSGPNVMLGYAEQASDLARGRDIAVLHTGDLAVRDADGDFRLVGRKQRFVKPYGLRVSLDAIEAKLAADGIRAMAAGDDGLIAIAATGHVGPASLRADLARWLSLPENLFDVVVLPEFPMLASGKRDYKSILGAAQLRRMSAKGLDTRGKGFAAQFSAILGREVQQSDSFISLHGDSLSYVNVLIAIDEYLGKVPDNWESLTVAELDALSLAAPVATPRWIKPFDTEVVLRALAIMAVVLVHAKFRIVSGGADALIILAGYNLARFNKGRLTAGLGWEIFENFVKRIILPFYFILLLYTIFRESPGITAFLLVDNLSSDPERLRTILAPFWFIQALLHCMLAIVVLFSFKPIRQLASTMPVAFAVILLMLATVIRVTAFSLYDHSYPRNFYTTDSIVVHFALGWLVFAAQSLRARLACVAAAALLGAANGGMLGLQDWIGGWPVDVGVRRMIWIVLVPALLLFIPRILLPVWIGRALTSVAAISFTIYLVHMLPIHLLRPFDAVSPFVKLAIALIVSFGVHALVTWLWRVKQAAWLSSRWRIKHS